MNDGIKNIAEMLPEGLTEESVEAIAKLVNEVIKEEVDSRIKDLQNTAVAFVRSRVDDLKDQAVKELELEDSTFRNAKLFESMRSMMSLELTEEDENHAAIAIAEDNKSLEETVDVLTDQLKEQLTENKKLQSVVKVQSDKISKLDEKVELARTGAKKLQEATKALEDSTAKPFKSSERGIVASDERDRGSDNTKEFGVHSPNEFLTEDMMNFMPNEVNDNGTQ